MKLPKNLRRFVLSSERNIRDAKYILFGVNDESGSYGFAQFQGSQKGPDAIRKASNTRSSYHREYGGKLRTFVTNTYKPIDKISFRDIGNKKKNQVTKTIVNILKANKFPIMLGGDHSLTYEVLRGFKEAHKKIAVVYFDAHPDFRNSEKDGRKSYGSVMYDATKLPHIDNKHCIMVGLRDIEPEEFGNIKKAGVVTLPPLEITKIGMQKSLNKIKKAVGNLPVYISMDLDVHDRSFVPGVSTPSPGGLTSEEVLFFVTGLAKMNVIGFDIVEHTTKTDVQDMTSHVASKLLIEFVVRNNDKSV